MPCATATRWAQIVEGCAPRWSYQLLKGCAGNQRKFTRFRDCRAVSEHGIPLALNCVQDLLTTTREELEVDGKVATDFANQRQSAIEPLAGTLNFKTHQLNKLRSVLG